MAKYKKLESAPEHFQPECEIGGEFEADFHDDTLRALVAAGWAEPAKAAAKKEDK